MKNFKFNAITALIIGVNVAVANAADGNILNITTQLPKVLVIITKFMPIILLDMVHIIK